MERIVPSDLTAEEELEQLALEGLNSGPAFEPGPDYWDQKHRRLDDRIEMPSSRSELAP